MKNQNIKDPNIKVKIEHSHSHPAWNIVGTTFGGKYKIATIPYLSDPNKDTDIRNRKEAREHAEFINYCLNNSTDIVSRI